MATLVAPMAAAAELELEGSVDIDAIYVFESVLAMNAKMRSL